ncbi:MAG: PAN domain-containing protein [Desulfobacterales bacterium]|jgi:hypothetical protein
MQKLFVVLLLLLWSSGAIAQQASVSIEPETDRPGSNYRNFDLEQPDVDFCVETCRKDPRCKAFTYVNPGIQGPKARCWLKDAVPPAKPLSGCISGVKTAGVTQSQSRAPQKMIQGEIKMSPESGAGSSETSSAGGQPTFPAHMKKEIIAKIPPASAHRVEKPKVREELINLLLSNPRTAPRLNQFASTMGMPAQELATKSSSGMTIAGGPVTVPPSGAKISLNWEAGIRFTPRFNAGSLSIRGVRLTEIAGYSPKWGLSDIYQRDEVLLEGTKDTLRIVYEGFMPHGEYIIEVELETKVMGINDRLKFGCSSCIKTSPFLLPWADKKDLATGEKISSFIGQFQMDHSAKFAGFWITLPYDFEKYFVGIFRGITFTRL